MKIEKKQRNDMILLGFILVVALISFGIMRWNHQKLGSEVVITVDGKVYDSCTLNENKVILISNEYGENTIVIDHGKVYMESANCPDQYCVKHSSIRQKTEVIVCLPHKLVVEVTGDSKETEELDGISQ